MSFEFPPNPPVDAGWVGANSKLKTHNSKLNTDGAAIITAMGELSHRIAFDITGIIGGSETGGRT